MTVVSVNAVSAPRAPDRVNEDGWVAVEDRTLPGWVAAAVIDGASVRGLLPSLETYLGERGYGSHPAVMATRVVRCALYHSFTHPPMHPRDALLKANRALRSALEAVPAMAEVYEILENSSSEPLPQLLAKSAEPLAAEIRQVFTSLFPDGRWRSLDTRYLRLLLPSCVATLVRINLSTRQFHFAHAGDTALVQVDAAGTIQSLCQDQMRPFDERMLQVALEAVQEPGNESHTVLQAMQSVPAVREMDRLNGVHHNYVDHKGQVQPEEGCGVVDGLAALSEYVQTGEGKLEPGDRLYLMSDGLTLPMHTPNATLTPPVGDSVARWRRALREGDLPILLHSVRDIAEEDASRDLFPRIHDHDDATALLIMVE